MEFKEVLTDKGYIYYRIEENNVFDDIIFARKIIKQIPPKFFGLIPEKEEVEYHVMRANRKMTLSYSDPKFKEYSKFKGIKQNSYSINIPCFYLKKDCTAEQRVQEIKEKIVSVLKMENSFDPVWDKVMIKDKAKLRDLLINDLMDNN